MLKKRCRLFLGLIVLASSACVTPTHASSANQVIITHVQASGSSGARAEFIALYNNSAVDAPITNWCLVNKANVAFACIGSQGDRLVSLPAYSSAVVASSEYAQTSGLPADAFTQVYEVTNQSSGSIVGSADTITLVDENDEVIDSHSWSSAAASGRIFQRVRLVEMPVIYASTGGASDWSVGVLTSLPENQVVYHEPSILNPPDPIDPEGPDTPGEGEGGTTGPGTGANPAEPLEDLYITEVLPNPEGSDSGGEFIEIYNPNAVDVALNGYTLRVGPGLEKSYAFLPNTVIAAGGYLAITNSDVRFTLLNTASKVQLFKGGRAVDPTVSYDSPKEGQSWAVFEELGWAYTWSVTPSAPNSLLSIPLVDSTTPALPAVQKPCAANQYRSPETGRCRLLSSATTGTPAPCAADQVRNVETGRCRKVQQAAAPAACKEGQERNIETGRCRAIKKMLSADYSVDTAATRAAEQGVAWYYWFAIAAIVVAILAYGVWEWREELSRLASAIRQKVARGTD